VVLEEILLPQTIIKVVLAQAVLLVVAAEVVLQILEVQEPVLVVLVVPMEQMEFLVVRASPPVVVEEPALTLRFTE
jgi:hypothetical protein